MARVNNVLKFDGKSPSLTARQAWAGIRYATHDRMPHAGRIRDGVHVLTGFGSRGFTWAPLTAEIVLSDILGLSCPVERSLKKRISPLRF
jgi:tRNA 5-methylaminomethyl-2-thiouridine biosynthesis bifunctional protein